MFSIGPQTKSPIRPNSHFKMFLLDEAWLFIKNETIRNYVVQAQKTWRKHNAAMILATQSIKELEQSAFADRFRELPNEDFPCESGDEP